MIVLEQFTPSGLPAISPTRGEIDPRLTFRPGRNGSAGRTFQSLCNARHIFSPPLWGRWPAGQRGVTPPS